MTITFEEDKAFHDDLHVCIPELKIDHYFDTYYFVIDYNFLPDEETEEKVKISLRNLLIDWEKAVSAMSINETVYLPIDFSDQYVGTLKIHREAENLLNISYATHHNIAIFPTSMNKFKFTNETESYNDPELFKIHIDDFIDEVRREYSKIKI